MLFRIHKIESKLEMLNEIPRSFFNRIEESAAFDDNLFPEWMKKAFSSQTAIRKKFKAVYQVYKQLPNANERKTIREAFLLCEDIQEICADPSKPVITIDDLPDKVCGPIKELFLYLYQQALEHPGFTNYIGETSSGYIQRFNRENKLTLCPFCGLGYVMLKKGEARPALDHWLHKEKYPTSAVNLNNLFPICTHCNQDPCKGSKDVLHGRLKKRDVTYYPYNSPSHLQVCVELSQFGKIDTPDDIDCSVDFECEEEDKPCVESWDYLMNIKQRYGSFFKEKVWFSWENKYSTYIEKEGIEHGSTIDEFKDNLRKFQEGTSYMIQDEPGAFLHQAFIKYLIEKAPEDFLYRLQQNFKGKEKAIRRILQNAIVSDPK